MSVSFCAPVKVVVSPTALWVQTRLLCVPQAAVPLVLSGNQISCSMSFKLTFLGGDCDINHLRMHHL